MSKRKSDVLDLTDEVVPGTMGEEEDDDSVEWVVTVPPAAAKPAAKEDRSLLGNRKKELTFVLAG